MQPDSLLYIYLFLPFCLVVYYLIPQKGKNTVLLLLSLVVFLSLDIFVQGFLQAGRQIFFQVGAVFRLPVLGQPLLHCHGQELLHRDVQRGGELAQRPGAAPRQRCFARADVRQRGPGDPAALGELIAGEALFPQDLLDRHMHHLSLMISTSR